MSSTSRVILKSSPYRPLIPLPRLSGTYTMKVPERFSADFMKSCDDFMPPSKLSWRLLLASRPSGLGAIHHQRRGRSGRREHWVALPVLSQQAGVGRGNPAPSFGRCALALRFADEHSTRLDRIAGLVSGMIDAHSVYPSLHRVFLKTFPAGESQNRCTRGLRLNTQASTPG
jgi:hypothetical protein